MENVPRAKSLDIREQYEPQLKELQEAYGEAMFEILARKKVVISVGRRREMITSVQQKLAAEGIKVSMGQLDNLCL